MLDGGLCQPEARSLDSRPMATPLPQFVAEGTVASSGTWFSIQGVLPHISFEAPGTTLSRHDQQHVTDAALIMAQSQLLVSFRAIALSLRVKGPRRCQLHFMYTR